MDIEALRKQGEEYKRWITPMYCTRCGKPTVEFLVKFDSQTGEPVMGICCPSFRSGYYEHDKWEPVFDDSSWTIDRGPLPPALKGYRKL